MNLAFRLGLPSCRNFRTGRCRLPIGAFALLACGLLAVAPSLASERVRFLHFSDLDRAESVPALATAIRQARDFAGTVRVTHGGDMLAPSLASSIDQGAHMISLMNDIGLDLAVPGNHEFDFGEEALERRVAESEFLWLSSNLSPSFPGTADYQLLAIGRHLVGVIGLTTVSTATISLPSEEREFRDPVAVAGAFARRLRANHADLVVALAHVESGVDLALLEHVDVVLGGHAHRLEAGLDERGLLVRTGPQGEHLAVVDIDLETVEEDGSERFVWTPDVRFASVRDLEPDAGILEKTRELEASIEAAFDRPVGPVLSPLDTRRPGLLRGESAFGNLVADAMRAHADSDIAILNSGAIQGDRVYERGEVLQLSDLRRELPYTSPVMTLEVSGAELLEALENGVSAVETGSGRFPQISGFSFEFDPRAEPGSRIRSVEVDGAPLATSRVFTLATNRFLASGGDGYTVLRSDGVATGASGSVVEAVSAWVAGRGGFAGALEGRIRALP